MKALNILLAALWLPCAVLAGTADAITLDAKSATIEDPTHEAKYESGGDRMCVGFWHTTNVVVRWTCDVPRKGAYRVILVHAAQISDPGSEVEVTVDGQRANGFVKPTGDWGRFEDADLGPVILRKPGQVEVTVKVTRFWAGRGMNLRAVRLERE